MLEKDQAKLIQATFAQKKYCIQDNFLSSALCEHFLAEIEHFRDLFPLSKIHRQMKGRSLRYSVIDGEMIEQHLPEIEQLYKEVNEFVNAVSGEEMICLRNKKVGVNVNITSAGGEYRWHYDRNAITVLLYLNEVTGGEIEFYPNYRLYLKGKVHTAFQKWLDTIFQSGFVLRLFYKRKVIIKPCQGRLVIIRGNQCLHSVRPVHGEIDRINIVLSYDTPLSNSFVGEKLDTYLYTQNSVSSDPNYN